MPLATLSSTSPWPWRFPQVRLPRCCLSSPHSHGCFPPDEARTPTWPLHTSGTRPTPSLSLCLCLALQIIPASHDHGSLVASRVRRSFRPSVRPSCENSTHPSRHVINAASFRTEGGAGLSESSLPCWGVPSLLLRLPSTSPSAASHTSPSPLRPPVPSACSHEACSDGTFLALLWTVFISWQVARVLLVSVCFN